MGNPSCRATDPLWPQERLDTLVHQVRRVHNMDLFLFDLTFLVRALSARTVAMAENPQAYWKSDWQPMWRRRRNFGSRFLSAKVSFSATLFSNQISEEKASFMESEASH